MDKNWLRYLLDTFGTRLRFLGDSDTGICFTVDELAVIPAKVTISGLPYVWSVTHPREATPLTDKLTIGDNK